MADKNAQNATLARPGGGTVTRPAGSGVTTWNPWNEMAEMRRQMDELFSRAFGYTPLSRMIPALPSDLNEPDVDIYETDDRVRLDAALPGFAPDQINVEVTADTVSIQGERKTFNEDEKAVQHRQSRMSGFTRFSASYSLPAEIDPNRVKANFRDGILHLEMPKTEQARTKGVKIRVEGAK
jgi:HSP20 family protein